MMRIKHILNFKNLVLTVGLVAGLTIIGLPIAQQHIVLPQVQTESDDDTNSQSQSEEQISSLEAITPVQQLQNIATDYFVLDEIFQNDDQANSGEDKILESISGNLIRVLFNFIIAPNAP